jgi:signal transduction histidine kinase
VLGIVAHDLRNPLGTIASQAALLRRRSQPRAGFEGSAGEIIQRAAARMTRLIADLLDVTRMEAGALSVQQFALSPIDLLQECGASQEQLAAAAGIELRVEAPAQSPPVWADRDRLCQVFENLVGNALKFTGSGGRVTLGASAGIDEVLFWVRDTGPGMPPEQLPHVFDRFWQARRVARQGAGLGLPIAKGLVEAHGGRMWAESSPGHGSCFLFTIPLAPAARS